MKVLHRPQHLGWSRFDEARNLDFHSVLTLRPGGNVVVDPLPLEPHDAVHLARLGGASVIIVTNSDHVRGAAALRLATGARVLAPRGERGSFPLEVDGWLGDGDEPLPGVRIVELDGGKTPGELAVIVDGDTVICGDLIRGHLGGRLNLLPDAKVSDRDAALASVRRLLSHERLDAVLVGDGWPVFRDGRRALEELLAASARDRTSMP